MFSVQIYLGDDNSLIKQMTGMREWLDHRHYQPSTFRYNFVSPGILFRIDFAIKAEAARFAEQFGGRVLTGPANDAALAGTNRSQVTG